MEILTTATTQDNFTWDIIDVSPELALYLDSIRGSDLYQTTVIEGIDQGSISLIGPYVSQ
jgi:hypothetical protein